MTESGSIQACRAWVQQVVIGLDLCPFAERTQACGRMRIQVCDQAGLDHALEALLDEVTWLDANPEMDTTLLVVTGARFEDFERYLDLLACAEQLLIDEGYEGVYQLASFHPDYQFEGTEPADPENYSNRSPQPILQVLREASVTRAVDAYEDAEGIPERNIARLRALGNDTLQAHLDACAADNDG